MINSATEFVRLRESELREDYARASSDEASAEVWREVIDSFPQMRKWVAHNKSVPLEILAILARDEDEMVRSTVADKRSLDRDLFELLSQDSSEIVRNRIAWNKRTPRDIVEKLKDDPCLLVRETVARRLCEQS